MKPMSRIEHYLAYLCGESLELPNAISRIERYLAYLCGKDDIDLPLPITKIEYYLSYLCGNEVDIPAPINRVDHYLAYLCGSDDIDLPEAISRLDYYFNLLIENGGLNSGVVKRWEIGNISTTTGLDVDSTNYIRSIGYIKLKPNTRYVIYDKDYDNDSKCYAWDYKLYTVDKTFKTRDWCWGYNQKTIITNDTDIYVRFTIENTTDLSKILIIEEVKPVYTSLDSEGYILLDANDYEMVVK